MSKAPRARDPFRLQGDDWKPVAGVGLLALCQAGLTVPSLLVVRELLDVDANSRTKSITLGFALGALVVLGVIVQRAARLQGLAVVARLVGRVRTALAARLASIGREDLADRDLDDVHADVVFASERVERAATSAIAGFYPSAIVVAVVGVMVLVLSPPLALALFVCSLPAVLLARMHRMHVVNAIRTFHRALGRYSGAVWDAMHLRDLISAHGGQRQVEARLTEAGLATGETQHLAQREQVRYSTSQHAIVGAAGGIALGVGAAFVGEHQARDLVMLVAAFGLVQSSLRTLVGSIASVLDGRAARASVHAFLESGPSAPPLGSPVRVDGARWDLEGVHFRYSLDAPAVIDGVDLHLSAGRIVGIEGPNGSGKTTLVALLLGWYRPTEGRLCVDGADAADIDASALRARIGLVPQEPQFLDASVRENLVFGMDPAPSEEVIAEALHLSTADQVVAARVEGLDERMGRNGQRFSGGERQRLAIARAVLRDPALLIVDEPTNHLDPGAAKTLLQNLAATGRSWAVLVVSHDHAVLAICDDVFRLDGGRLEPVRQSKRADA